MGKERAKKPCPELKFVQAYLDDRLPAEERASFERHLNTCPQCRKEMQAFRGVSTALREVGGQQLPPLDVAAVEGKVFARRRARPGTTTWT